MSNFKDNLVKIREKLDEDKTQPSGGGVLEEVKKIRQVLDTDGTYSGGGGLAEELTAIRELVEDGKGGGSGKRFITIAECDLNFVEYESGYVVGPAPYNSAYSYIFVPADIDDGLTVTIDDTDIYHLFKVVTTESYGDYGSYDESTYYSDNLDESKRTVFIDLGTTKSVEYYPSRDKEEFLGANDAIFTLSQDKYAEGLHHIKIEGWVSGSSYGIDAMPHIVAPVNTRHYFYNPFTKRIEVTVPNAIVSYANAIRITFGKKSGDSLAANGTFQIHYADAETFDQYGSRYIHAIHRVADIIAGATRTVVANVTADLPVLIVCTSLTDSTLTTKYAIDLVASADAKANCTFINGLVYDDHPAALLIPTENSPAGTYHLGLVTIS